MTEPLVETLRGPDTGYVYLFKCENYYKIGIAQDVMDRLSNLQIGNPFEISMVKHVRVFHPYVLEEELHCRQERYRTSGEWFKLPQEALDEVKTRMDLEVEDQVAAKAQVEQD